MTDPQVRELARRIHELEQRIATLGRARQLDVSSIPVTVDGDEGPETVDVPLASGVSRGVQAWDQSVYAIELAEQLETELGPLPGQIQEALDGAQSALTEAGLARSDAAVAVEDASQAAADAAQAISDALAAASLAAGSNTWADAAPTAGDAAGKPIGAVWFQYDGAGLLAAVWELRPLGWVVREFDEAIIPQVAIGTGTYGSLSGSRIVAKSILADQIAALAITAEELAANAVIAVKIAANAVTAEKINAGAVTTDKLDALAVTAEKIAAGAIIAEKIAAGAITAGKLAAEAIDGMTITGALIRTAPSGQRMQFDVNGLQAFNSAGAQTARIYSGSGGMELLGQMRLAYESDPRHSLLAPGSLNLYDDTGTLLMDSTRTTLYRGSLANSSAFVLDEDHNGIRYRYRGSNGSKRLLDVYLGRSGSVDVDGEDYSHLVVDEARTTRVRTNEIQPSSGSELSFLAWSKITLDAPEVVFQGDTDWVDLLSYVFPTWRNICQARRKAGMIEILFNGGSGSIPVGNTALANFPTDWAPKIAPNRRAGAYFGSGYTGVFYITPDGEFGVSQQTGGARNNCQGHMLFVAD